MARGALARSGRAHADAPTPCRQTCPCLTSSSANLASPTRSPTRVHGRWRQTTYRCSTGETLNTREPRQPRDRTGFATFHGRAKEYFDRCRAAPAAGSSSTASRTIFRESVGQGQGRPTGRSDRRLSNRLQRPIPLVLQHRTVAHIILNKAGAGDRNDEKVFADHKRVPGRLGGPAAEK